MADIPADTHSDAPIGTDSPFSVGRRRGARVPWPVLGAISAGGAIGALARYGLGLVAPHAPPHAVPHALPHDALPDAVMSFPWGTFAVNASGCLLIGVLMVLVSDVWPGRRLLRPFLGTGLLGGYTTFSTYIVDVQHLIGAGAVGVALTYLAGTLLAALGAVHAGMTATRVFVERARRVRRSKEAR